MYIPQGPIFTVGTTGRRKTVLEAGPYPRIYPPSEGVSCSLMLRVGDSDPFFTIERADEPDKPDEVADLIAAIKRP